MGRNRRRGRRRRRHDHFAQPENDSKITGQGAWDGGDAGRGRTRNRRGKWQDNRRLERLLPEAEALCTDLEDDFIDDQPPMMYDPLEQIIKHHQQQNTRNHRNSNNKSTHNPPFQQPSNFNHTSFQRRQQLLQQQQQQTLQRHLQRNDKYGCHDCRTARKANVRLRNALHSHIKSATATLAEWSNEVGVPFGGVADDEMDWQPEPEIRVVFVPQHQQQGDRRRYYNTYYHSHHNTGGGLSPIECLSAPEGSYVGYGGYDRHEAYAGHAGGGQGMLSDDSVTGGGITAAPWWVEPEIASLEGSTKEITPDVSPEELYHLQQQPMALEPDPFKAPSRGSGFAYNDGVSPLGMLANQSTANPSFSSSAVVENRSATPPCGTLASITSAPHWGFDVSSQQEKTSPEVLRKYRVRY